MVFSRQKPDAPSQARRGNRSSPPPQTASSGAAIDPSLTSGLPPPPSYNPLASNTANARSARRGSRTNDLGSSGGGDSYNRGTSADAPVAAAPTRRGSGSSNATGDRSRPREYGLERGPSSSSSHYLGQSSRGIGGGSGDLRRNYSTESLSRGGGGAPRVVHRVGMECLSPINVARDGPSNGGECKVLGICKAK